MLVTIENPYGVYDMLPRLVSEARHTKTIERQSQYLHAAAQKAKLLAG